MCTYTHIHIYVHTCIHSYCTHTHTYAYIHTYTYMYRYTYVNTHIHTWIHCSQIQYYVRASHPVNVYVLNEENYHKYATKAAFSFEAGPTLLDSRNHSLAHYIVHVTAPSRYVETTWVRSWFPGSVTQARTCMRRL